MEGMTVMAGDTPVGLRHIRLGDLMDSQWVIPEVEFIQVVPPVGMVDTLAEATIMEEIIIVAIADTITEGMHQEGPYSELFWVE